MEGVFITVFVLVTLIASFGVVAFFIYRRTLREAKNYERGLKMVPILIHLPPASDDIDGGSRDMRDLTEEVLSQAQVMYNIIASTATKGFKSKIYGQRHISFEIVAREGLVYYYAVVPTVLTDIVRQAIIAAYPSARLEEVTEHNVFSQVGKMSGTIGGEFTLKKEYIYPIATYLESKRDASRALLNAISAATREDGVGIQVLMRPAKEGWTKNSISRADQITKDKGSKKTGLGALISPKDIMEALWKPPEKKEDKLENKELSAVERAKVEAIQEKTRYPGFEILIRVVVSSNTSARANALMQNIVAAFALFDSPSFNGFKYIASKDIEELTTAFIFRFFPPEISYNILNTVELATLFHLPDQNSIPTSQVKRQMSKQVDGPTQLMEDGLLLGYNEFRGVKKPIRITDKDRRRHIHIIGQTGVGKSVLQENMAFQDMMDGRGFAFVDPHGDSVEALLSRVPKERVEDVIYFNPSDIENPIGFNMFEAKTQEEIDFVVAETNNMLYSLYDPGHTGIVGPRMENVVRNAAVLLMSDPAGGTFMDIPKVLVDQEFARSKLKYLKNQRAIDFWTKEWPAAQKSNEAGELVSWIVSKWAPFENVVINNILGQTKSAFNIREVMDSKKILLVNLSKGLLGEQAAKLLGMVFVMKFQAAAMSRADTPESEREDFCLYVDEFQNFATDSFESILSEARKYRLSLVLGNQFMTQLKENVREAIIGNVGTSITGRVGITDAEIMVKKYAPVFDAEDLTKLPNYESVCVVQIQGVPSAPFSMNWVPPMGQPNKQLSDALKRLSAAKYGRSRAEVEKELFNRLRSPTQSDGPAFGARPAVAKPSSSGSSFLDEWLAKRKQLSAQAPPSVVGVNNTTPTTWPPAQSSGNQAQPKGSSSQPAASTATTLVGNDVNSTTSISREMPTGSMAGQDSSASTQELKTENKDHLSVRDQGDGDEVSFKLR